MKKNDREAAAKPEIEKLQQTKRTYRAALDLIKRLDDAVKKQKSIKDLFQPEVLALRNRLKEVLSALMFLNPEEFGQKAEELLWRKVYYEIIQTVKQNKNVAKEEHVEENLDLHLLSAVGFYHHLLLKIQEEYKLDLHSIADWPFLPDKQTCSTITGKKETGTSKAVETRLKSKEWARKACHRCLTYLGDIARYQEDFGSSYHGCLAIRYYQEAILMNPNLGMPYNQLGTLSSTQYHCCQAAYYYMRCMMTASPFEGAYSNLQHIFEKNRKKYSSLMCKTNTKNLASPSAQRCKDVKRFVVEFLYLLELLQPESNLQAEGAGQDGGLPALLASLCQAVPHDFSVCMLRPPSAQLGQEKSQEKEQILPDDLVFKIMVMMLICIHRLQIRGSSHISVATAFTLALFSHIVNHVNIRINAALHGTEQLPEEMVPEQSQTNKEQLSPASTITPDNSQEVEEEGTSRKKERRKQKVRALLRMRRRRREGGEAGDSDQSDISEDEIESSQLDLSQSDDGSQSPASSSSSGSGGSRSPGFSHLTMDTDSDDSSHHSQQEQALAHPGPPAGQTEAGNEAAATEGPHSSGPPSNLSSPRSASKPDGGVLQRNSRLAARFDAYYHEGQGQETGDSRGQLVSSDDNKSESDSHAPTTQSISADKEKAGEDKLAKIKDILKVLETQKLLAVIKIFVDWLRTQPKLIKTCGESLQSMWTKLAVLLNHLPPESQLNNEEICSSAEVLSLLNNASEYSDWQQTLPLTEDIVVFKLAPLTKAHHNMDFSRRSQINFSNYEELLVRICCLRHFGYLLSKMEEVQFEYDKDENVFYGAERDRTSTNNAQAQLKMAEEETRRDQLMRDMAQLRLQSEVIELEGSLNQSRSLSSSLSPYIVPDASVLSHHFGFIKQLAQSARFIIIIPQAVIDTLDRSKKEQQGARDAIKFLEREFHKGNRYIRAQKEKETAKHFEKNATRKEDKDAWGFYRILDCCLYFAKQSSDSDAGGMVTVLTNHKPGEPLSIGMQSALKEASHLGISVEYVLNFRTKWKSQ